MRLELKAMFEEYFGKKSPGLTDPTHHTKCGSPLGEGKAI
jgi:hypothetical protein